MYHFRIIADRVVEIAETLTAAQCSDPSWISRHDIKSLEHAAQIAAQTSALINVALIPVDNGEHCWPRYDVVEAPQVGAPVSRVINGDYRPDGEIVRISGQHSRIVTTSTGRRYYRRRLSAVWIADKCYSMVAGHINRTNLEF